MVRYQSAHYRPRVLISALRRCARTFPALVVTGPRQCGKTTLLRQELGTEFAYVTLDSPHERQLAASDPAAFFAAHPPPLILDEVQNVPELMVLLRAKIDEDRRPGRWILTGSQTFPLMKGIMESLAGRAAILELDPLSTSEAWDSPEPADIGALLEQVFHGASPLGDRVSEARIRDETPQWFLRGAYPEPCVNLEVDRQVWLGSYIATYIDRDVRDLLRIGDLAAFRRFLFLVAARSGTILNMTDLGRDAGITGPTVKAWLTALETSRLVHLLPPYFENFGKRVTRAPKLYFLDVGLLTYLWGLHTPDAVQHSPQRGALMETAVVAEWLKAFRHRGLRPPLSYFKSAGIEVDLIIDYDGRRYGLEVKSTSSPRPPNAEGLSKWLTLAGPPAPGALARAIPTPTILDSTLPAIPWFLASFLPEASPGRSGSHHERA